jgi:FtsZ-binding cell division protein ZapB
METLESKVFSAVDTIESLRSEINGLREERLELEDKLRELIGKMDNLERDSASAGAEDNSENTGNDSPPPFGSNL